MKADTKPTDGLGEPSGELLLKLTEEAEGTTAADIPGQPPAEPNPEKLKVREGADPSAS